MGLLRGVLSVGVSSVDFGFGFPVAWARLGAFLPKPFFPEP